MSKENAAVIAMKTLRKSLETLNSSTHENGGSKENRVEVNANPTNRRYDLFFFEKSKIQVSLFDVEHDRAIREITSWLVERT